MQNFPGERERERGTCSTFYEATITLVLKPTNNNSKDLFHFEHIYDYSKNRKTIC